jgi:hypothetical protein
VIPAVVAYRLLDVEPDLGVEITVALGPYAETRNWPEPAEQSYEMEFQGEFFKCRQI